MTGEKKNMLEVLLRSISLLDMSICPNCDGSGVIPVQISERQYITRDMALDAGNPNYEGEIFSEETWSAEQCQWCAEKKEITNWYKILKIKCSNCKMIFTIDELDIPNNKGHCPNCGKDDLIEFQNKTE